MERGEGEAESRGSNTGVLSDGVGSSWLQTQNGYSREPFRFRGPRNSTT